ncbi:MAG: hypothetical protein O3B38_05545, partial [Chloroflexi bacterium]|nr:hypothetical protein [Chloroflexota bacterium]
VQDTNQAVAQLLTGEVDVVFGETGETLGASEAHAVFGETLGAGEVDVVFGETLGAGEEVATVKAAADEGDVKIFFTPSATWEHIDFNFNTK